MDAQDLEPQQLLYQSLVGLKRREFDNQEIHYFASDHRHHKYILHLEPIQSLGRHHLDIDLRHRKDE